MKYVDANIFIISVAGVESKALLAQKILNDIAEGKIDAFTSTLTWDEAVWGVRRVLNAISAKDEGNKLILFPNLRFISVDSAVISEAQSLINKYGLKPRDAIHAACAIKNGIKEFISDDPDFDIVSEIKRISIEDFM